MKIPSLNRLLILKDKYLNTKLVFLLDLMLSCLASLFVVLSINYMSESPNLTTHFLLKYMAVSFMASCLMFLFLKTYRIIIRHFTVRDGVPFILATAGKALILLGVMMTSYNLGRAIPFILLLDFFLTLFLLIGVRVLMIVTYEFVNTRVQDRFQYKRVLVYGTGDKCIALVRQLVSVQYVD